MKALLRRVVGGVDGQDLIEYSLLIGIITVASMLAMASIGGKITQYILGPERRHALSVLLRARVELREVGAILMAKSWCRSSARRAVRLLRQNDDGQDLIEYALLTAIIAIAGVLVFPTIQSKMADAYQDWNNNVYAISETPPPM